MTVSHVLSQTSLMIIFSYTPAGLGHLRVIDALYDGLPKGITPYLLGSQDVSLSNFHRIGSSNLALLRFTEWMQNGAPEDLYVFFYRRFLRSHTKLIYEQLTTILDQRIDRPNTVLVVATHFGLAHQIAAVKQRLINEKNLRVILVVQVTDDSPQHIWYVENADLIVVPSDDTREKLEEYGKKAGLKPARIEVLPYPISPFFSQGLTQEQKNKRKSQLDATSYSQIHLAIPVSGAAIGLKFFTILIDELYKLSQRFHFHVVVKTSKFTQSFINDLLSKPYITIYTAKTDRDIVNTYEDVYKNEIISLEITKPSEQAFKALVSPNQKAGSILLFSDPVGRQEYDNLDFLRRHNLIPLTSEQKRLYEKEKRGNGLNGIEDKRILTESRNWRGIKLPGNPVESAHFIWWCLKQQIFSEMMHCQVVPKGSDQHAHELSGNGVKKFWELVDGLVKTV